MDTSGLKTFAQAARRSLRDQVTAKLDQVIAVQSAARREVPQAVQQLDREIANSSRDQVIEKVAYTWFNRFSALRFMDVNEHTATRLVSPADGQTRPEILSEAMAGVLPDTLRAAAAEKIRALLDGRAPSSDPQGEAYRLLLVAACNQWHSAMPFMFEEIADYTELLMPEDLLSATSIIAQMRAVMTEEACHDVEVIGWLYQFYISEKKDQVFDGLKKNIKITAENIPAATQLFTPHWIVRYLVENSLGRLWMLNRPQSKLTAQMDYYILPEEPETDFLRISKPEEIKICDPACGSGHMLTYAFDLLYAIYEEEGYDPASIPDLILTHNLHGIEIDDRAGALAAFALVMKAAGRRRRFLRAPVQPNICVMQDVSFTASELADCAAVVGRDLYSAELRETLGQFTQAKNIGALIIPRLRDPAETARVVALKKFEGDLLLRDLQARVVQVLRMAEALSPKHHVVVANPPYMGGKGMNDRLKSWLTDCFPSSKSDLMTSFMERCGVLARPSGYFGMINLPAWMFIETYEELRGKLLSNHSLLSLLHLGRGVFGSDFGSVAFVLRAIRPTEETVGSYRRLFDKHVNVRTVSEIESLFLNSDFGCFRVKQSDLSKVPGTPISYWASAAALSAFKNGEMLRNHFDAKQGLATAEDSRFLRFWHEVSGNLFSQFSGDKWFPFQKGGEFRKWYGNHSIVINWKTDGAELRAFERSVIRNPNYYMRPGITWSIVSSGAPSFRSFGSGFVFGHVGPAIFEQDRPQANGQIIGLLNSAVSPYFLSLISETFKYEVGHLNKFPILHDLPISRGLTAAIDLARSDWDAFETSWDFSTLPLLNLAHRQASLPATYAQLRAHWQGMTSRLQALEEENNRIFIDAYGLQDELTPSVALEEITLTCNPAYRYSGKKSASELEALLQADTVREFVSYAVGCMFGRYSLDASGLILSNQGDGLAEYLAKVPDPSFAPDADNVIPILDEDWFPDDVTERFRRFLRVTFGEDHFQDNLAFIEKSLGKDIRKYFTKDFFNDHVKRYKKRPIYWLFSSPKGTFNALIYMHRYTADTVGVLLNDYVREFRSKLETRKAEMERQAIRADASPGQQTAALKEQQKIALQIDELDRWERDVVYPMASQRIEIDLDDGVKANYPKFEGALKPIKGLSDVED